MTPLKLGVPKGSLQDTTIELLKKSGWRVSTNSRSYFPTIDDPEISMNLKAGGCSINNAGGQASPCIWGPGPKPETKP